MTTPSLDCGHTNQPSFGMSLMTCRVTFSRLLRVACVLLIGVGCISTAGGQVVVNEILYRPGAGYPEPTALEFIELHNPTNAPVDLSGWALTSGVSFAFPAGASISAGGYVVIGADPAALQNTYGISGVFGPWAAGATLANGGEKITLSKPGVVAGTLEDVDSVTYASEGRLGDPRPRDDIQWLGLEHAGQWRKPVNGITKPANQQ
jgi:hypothetical protein